MFKRFHFMLLALSLLALTTACSAADAAVQPAPPDTTPEAPRTDPDPSLTPPAPTAPNDDTLDQEGLSPRTTPGHVWAEPIIEGDTVTILLSVARMADHVHFEVPTDGDPASFVGYFVGNAFLVRPCVCPTCGAETVDWESGALACGTCPAMYDAVSGAGVGGAISYPSGLISNRIALDTISMSRLDLIAAYERTVAGEGVPSGGDDVCPVLGCC